MVFSRSNIARNVRTLRKLTSKSFSMLSDRTGMTVSTLRAIERGYHEPKMNEIISLASALNASLKKITDLEVRDRMISCSPHHVGKGKGGARKYIMGYQELAFYRELNAYLDSEDDQTVTKI